MDPVTAVSLAGACVSLALRAATAASAIETVSGADRSVTSLATMLRLFGVSLEQLHQWLAAAVAGPDVADVLLEVGADDLAVGNRRAHG